MILKTCFLLVLTVAWEVSGASFSNMFMQTGPEATPTVEYLQYGAPSYGYQHSDSQLAELKVAPVGIEYAHPIAQSFGRAPCIGAECYYPVGQTIASLPPVPPTSNVVAYAVPGNNGQIRSGFEYSYVIVNENDGPRNLQSELGNTGVLRGEYAFLQPEGIIREVQLVADDSQGFNAIVKNFLPIEEVKHTEIVHHHAPPCPEAKSGALIAHEGHHENHEAHIEQKPHGEHHEEHHDVTIVMTHESHPEGHHESHPEGHHESHPEGHQEGHHDSHHENPESGEEKPEESKEKEELEHHLKAHHEGEHTPENVEIHSHQTHEKIVEISHTEGHIPHEAHHVVPQAHEHDANVFVSYNDIIKCIQAAMAKANAHPSAPRPASPLTYLVFNKPC